MRHVYLVTAFVCVLVCPSSDCAQQVHFAAERCISRVGFPGMKHQPKPYSQGSSKFFADGRPIARRPGPSWPARRSRKSRTIIVRDDDRLYAGKTLTLVCAWFPPSLTVDLKFIERGQDRYSSMSPLPRRRRRWPGTQKMDGCDAYLHDDRLRQIAEGEIYNTITNARATCFRTRQTCARDRWPSSPTCVRSSAQIARCRRPGDHNRSSAQMSTHAASVPSSLPARTRLLRCRQSLAWRRWLAVTALGLLVSPAQHIAIVPRGFSFCTAIAIGMLMLILIHHIFDASCRC